MTKLILTRGVPASGKTTWAKQWLAEHHNRARVNRDDLRFSSFGRGWNVDEQFITEQQNAAIIAHLKAGRDTVVDNTNLKAKDVKSLMRLAKAQGAEVEFKDFNIDLEEAHVRNDARRADPFTTGGVPPAVINSFFDRFIKKGKLPKVPSIDDEQDFNFKPYRPQIGLPHAVIVDIDGTLAQMDGRGPYDTSLYHTDKVDWIIKDLVNNLSDTKMILITSGRDAAYRQVLIDWLNKHGVEWDRIFMRPEGDERNDAIVKDELFETQIKDYFYVDFALDDRNRVVDMWRAKGIKCLQVQPGDF